MITKKQKQVFDFVKKYYTKYDYAPTLLEIKRKFKLASVSTAHYYLKKLQEAGQLIKEFNQPRAVSIVDKKQTMDVPILGVIAAGQPIEVIEVPNETITITKDEISKQGKHYALRVQGNSMINDGIFDGDIVVIRKKGKFRLQPANHTLFPIYRDEVEVRGVVVKIIRNLESQIEKDQSNEKYIRRIDYSWDYRGENTKTYTHGIHTYPAMFIPQVARRLLETYSKEGDTICDIFCGSGTSLVESRVLNRNAYGIDLNPLAIFLAKAKTAPINPQKLTREYIALLSKLEKIKDSEIKKPEFKNIDFWFKEKVIIKLARLKKAIQEIEDKAIRNFLMVAFSETVRYASNTKTGEFKLVRIKGEKLEKHDPDVFGIFRKKAEAALAGVSVPVSS